MTKKSPGGSKIIRHAERDRDWTPPSGESAAEEIEAHMEKHRGPIDSVLHELVSDLVHVDVHIIPPTQEKNYFTLFTTGMSDLPMAVPSDLPECAYAELMVSLPASWKVTADDERWYWPIRTLKMLARLPHEYETWLGAGHTIPNGDPAEPYAAGTKLCCAFLLPTVLLEEEARAVRTAKGRTINLYAVHFLHEEEVDLKLEEGTDALIDAFNEHDVSEVLDPGRPPAVRK